MEFSGHVTYSGTSCCDTIGNWVEAALFLPGYTLYQEDGGQITKYDKPPPEWSLYNTWEKVAIIVRYGLCFLPLVGLRQYIRGLYSVAKTPTPTWKKAVKVQFKNDSKEVELDSTMTERKLFIAVQKVFSEYGDLYGLTLESDSWKLKDGSRYQKHWLELNGMSGEYLPEFSEGAVIHVDFNRCFPLPSESPADAVSQTNKKHYATVQVRVSGQDNHSVMVIVGETWKTFFNRVAKTVFPGKPLGGVSIMYGGERITDANASEKDYADGALETYLTDGGVISAKYRAKKK